MIWFTSDTHFNHENIIKYSNRPFLNLEDMTEALVNNWNALVNKNDTVFHLGDFALSRGKKHNALCDRLLERLQGQKWLITGNHDRDEVVKNGRWIKVKSLHEIRIDLGGMHKQRIVMCHYPLRTWPQIHRGSWMLHGHSHGNLKDIGGKTLDVGVDVHGYSPVSIDKVQLFMDGRGISSCDHHEVKS